VILSEILAALTRKAMRAAPLHVVTAPKMASGKTLLATVGGYVATGRAPAMMSQAEDPESERKRLLAVLLEGAPLVVIDNVERPLKSDALCSVLTEPLFTDRLLGFSRTADRPTNALFVATGNNIVVAGDLTARAVVCTLDPMCERPEERRFRVDLHDWVPRNRGRLVAAALTVVRAYLAAGEPMKGRLPNFARFEDWSRLVREPLVVARHGRPVPDQADDRGARSRPRAADRAAQGVARGVRGDAGHGRAGRPGGGRDGGLGRLCPIRAEAPGAGRGGRGRRGRQGSDQPPPARQLHLRPRGPDRGRDAVRPCRRSARRCPLERGFGGFVGRSRPNARNCQNAPLLTLT
jgi:hypothetical protein